MYDYQKRVCCLWDSKSGRSWWGVNSKHQVLSLAFTKGIYSRDRLRRYCSNIMGEDAGCHAGDGKQADWASQANPRVI